MKLGTRSLLFGVHQFIWHPFTVWRAWCHIYRRRPTWRQAICIVVHDWGYWGCAEMDGPEGELHPYRGAAIAHALLDKDGSREWETFCLGHSRTMSRILGIQTSRLCPADKLSIAFDPAWFYLIRARATGELAEYRKNSDARGFITAAAPDRCWHAKMVKYEKEAETERERQERMDYEYAYHTGGIEL